jgi:hypothetical protein
MANDAYAADRRRPPVTPGRPGFPPFPCVKGGAKYVFVSKGKVYVIQNQDFGTLAANAGARVQLTGDVDKDGKSITVTKIAPPGK